MLDKLKKIISEFESLNEKLTDPNVVNDIKMYQKISQDFSNIKDKAELAQNYISKLDELQEIKNILENETDAEMKELALDEQNSLQTEIDNLELFRYELKGELTIVISENQFHKKDSQNLNESDKRLINQMINKLSVKEIVSLVNQGKKISKKEIYDYCIRLKNEN